MIEWPTLFSAADQWLWLPAFIPVVGHVLYGLPNRRAGGHTRISLHNGDDFAPSDEPPRPDRLRNVCAIGGSRVAELSVSGDRESGVFIDAPDDAAMIAAETQPAFIELASEKFDSYLRHEGLEHVIETRSARPPVGPGREIYSKHIKVVLAPMEHGASLLTPAQLPVEFVTDLAAGIRTRRITATLLVAGVHKANQQVRVTHRAIDAPVARDVWVGRSDSAGLCEFDLDAPGFWRLHAVVMQPHDGDAADWRSYWACLTFEV